MDSRQGLVALNSQGTWGRWWTGIFVLKLYSFDSSSMAAGKFKIRGYQKTMYLFLGRTLALWRNGKIC
jgi:hypothetical protein